MALIDDILSTINASLTTNLSWLNTAYGKVQRCEEKNASGRDISYPGIYVGGEQNGYESLLPNSTLGNNYSYFEIEDPVEYKHEGGNFQPVFKFKWVLWFYWPDLYEDWQDRLIEEVKAQVLTVFAGTPYTRTAEIFEIAESADEIYSGYDHQEVDKLFLMRPYGGLSVSGEIYGAMVCNLDLPTPVIPLGAAGLNYSTSEQRWPLSKYLGLKSIYWKTFVIGNSTGENYVLTGLTTATVDRIIDAIWISKSAIDGTWSTTAAEITPDGDGQYEVFTSVNQQDIHLTLRYTKP